MNRAAVPRTGAALVVALVALVTHGAAVAPVPAAAQEAGPLRVETNLPDGWIGARDPLTVAFDRPLRPAERVAVFFGHTDATDLFRAGARGLTYDPAAPPLPRGETELVVWLVDDDEWEALVRRPLRVRNRLGLETSEVDPGVDVTLEGPLGRGREPPDPDPEPLRAELTGKIGIETRHVRGATALGATTTILAAGAREDALRFSEKGEDAPRVDLSSYRVDLEHGPASLSVGRVRFGDHRHLVRSFNSRGAELAWSPVDRVDLAVSVQDGSSQVGWDNLLGVGDPDHRLAAATLGVDALDRGALRVELTWLGASVLPRSGFNRGEITDAERSNGLGLSVTARTPGRRLQLEGGYARSRYDNPDDPSLAQDDALIPVQESIRYARYLEATAGLLDGHALGDRSLDLDLVFRHERIDPEYQSIGAYVRSDQLVNDVQLHGAVAGLDLRVSHARSSDNLDELANLLTTRTRRTGIQASLPLGRALDIEGPAASWLPRLRYRQDRTHQFGDGIPDNSGFSPGHVPDQVSLRQTVEAAWRWRRASLAWKLDLSDQDNRQEGREDADLKNRVHGLALGVRPHHRVSVDLGLDLERRESVERDEVERTRRWSARLRLTPYTGGSVAVSWSATHVEDDHASRERDAARFDARWSTALPFLDRFDGQGFVRYSRGSDARVDRVRDLDDHRSNWALHTGLSFGLFQ